MSTFVLAHGGGHRAWHWHLLRPLLEARGHVTLAPEIPMDDARATSADWATSLVGDIDSIAELEDVILVGHSLAGLALPLVATNSPIARLVFLCANVPVPAMAYADHLAENPDAVTVPPLIVHDDGRVSVSWETAREVYYPDCQESVAREAFAHLVPSAALLANRQPCRLQAWPAVPSSYILCEEDRVIGPGWSRRVSVDRLATTALELPGGHSPFLSRPEHLAEVLSALA
jgi:hypothetical protein